VFVESFDPLRLSLLHRGRPVLTTTRQGVLERRAKQWTERCVYDWVSTRRYPAQPDQHRVDIRRHRLNTLHTDQYYTYIIDYYLDN